MTLNNAGPYPVAHSQRLNRSCGTSTRKAVEAWGSFIGVSSCLVQRLLFSFRTIREKLVRFSVVFNWTRSW